MKQVIEIEVPQGKKVVYKNGTIVFEDIDILSTLTTYDSIISYLEDNHLREDILDTLDRLGYSSFESEIAFLRAVIYACTNAEKLSFTKGEIWFPTVQLCETGKEDDCLEKEIVGYVSIDSKVFTVLGYLAINVSCTGLSYFFSNPGISVANSIPTFLLVSSERVAKHISKYFGKTVFEVMYGGCNYDWKWVNS